MVTVIFIIIICIFAVDSNALLDFVIKADVALGLKLVRRLIVATATTREIFELIPARRLGCCGACGEVRCRAVEGARSSVFSLLLGVYLSGSGSGDVSIFEDSR